MIQNGQHDKRKPNYLFILSLSLNHELNDRGHAHKSSQSCQKSKSSIVHYDNHPTTQVSIVQPLKEKELNNLSRIYACLLHILGNPPRGRCWCWCWGLQTLLYSLGATEQEHLVLPHLDLLDVASV